ncbi:MAG: C1 family peptidase [Candidatus Aminicenantales bacterium]
MKRGSINYLPTVILIGLAFFLACQKEETRKGAISASLRDTCIYQTEKIEGKETTTLTMDFSSVEKPTRVEDFSSVFHLPPTQQGKTSACWSFAVTSLLEAEMMRLGRPVVKLSEMYIVYWEFVEKARRFVREKGNSFFGGGSEPNAVIERMKQYGAVAASEYPGLLPERSEHNHAELFQEMQAYLHSCQQQNYWEEEKIISHLRKILDKHLGPPPTKVNIEGKALTPQEFVNNYLQLPLDDYVAIMSFKYLPFYTRGEFKVPDNWWHSKDYYNVPLEDFYQAILRAIKKGFSLVLSVDFSEPGNSGQHNIGIIPSFDIPRQYIDQDSRELRFFNSSTTDDHGVHLVGYKESSNGTWFLLKDSWWTAYTGPIKGYFFYRDDYVKLKALAFLVHREAVEDLLAKF